MVQVFLQGRRSSTIDQRLCFSFSSASFSVHSAMSAWLGDQVLVLVLLPRCIPNQAEQLKGCVAAWMPFRGTVPVGFLFPLSEKSRPLQWVSKSSSDIYEHELLFSSARERRQIPGRTERVPGRDMLSVLYLFLPTPSLLFAVGVMRSQYGRETLKRLLCRSLSESPTIYQNRKRNEHWFLWEKYS